MLLRTYPTPRSVTLRTSRLMSLPSPKGGRPSPHALSPSERGRASTQRPSAFSALPPIGPSIAPPVCLGPDGGDDPEEHPLTFLANCVVLCAFILALVFSAPRIAPLFGQGGRGGDPLLPGGTSDDADDR